ncbi:hypothetical protein [Bifidobacterium phasiani]|nr:hypothetical protein [Bifidobacterium phasiani]
MNKNETMLNEALRSPLAATDPSLGSYALGQAAWKAIRRVLAK